jgi:hypothetical protein
MKLPDVAAGEYSWSLGHGLTLGGANTERYRRG